MTVDEMTARWLAVQIRRTPGWHARVEHNGWSGRWHVEAWLGEGDEAEENSYTLRYATSWARLRDGLATEAVSEHTR